MMPEAGARRQTLMFSATWPKEVRALADEFQHAPVRIHVGHNDKLVANSNITQHVRRRRAPLFPSRLLFLEAEVAQRSRASPPRLSTSPAAYRRTRCMCSRAPGTRCDSWRSSCAAWRCAISAHPKPNPNP